MVSEPNTAVESVEHQQKGEVVWAKFSQCFVGEYNPRPQSQVGDLTSLAESIKATGIQQMPLARWVDSDGVQMLEIVYGQRRFLAAQLAYGVEGGLHLLVKSLTDEQAELAAITENTENLPMTPVAQAESAARAVARYKGNRVEAAKRLGWKLQFLDDRLKLMSCSEAVRARLVDADPLQIEIAELLAGLKSEQQDEMLARYDELGKPTVAAFKSVLMQVSKQFAAAIFNKDDCATCQYNSSIQRAMFATGLEEGHCMNASCFDAKTEARLNERAQELREAYQVVRILRPGEAGTYIKLRVDGPTGVGEEQEVNCRACTNYGAVVSGHPDSLGRVGGGVCFDVACNNEKVTTRQAQLKSEAAIEDAKASATDAADPASAPGAGSRSAEGSKAKGESKGEGKSDGKKPVLASITLTNSVREYRDKLYRTVIAQEIDSQSTRGLALLVALTVNSRLSAINTTKAKEVLAELSGDSSESRLSGRVGKSFLAAVGMEPKKLGGMVSKLSLLAIEALTSEELVQMIQALEPDWNVHFKLGPDFFKTLTKSEMQSAAIGVGLKTKMGKDFDSVFKQKNDEVIKSLTTVEGFNYQGAIPKVLLPDFSKS